MNKTCEKILASLIVACAIVAFGCTDPDRPTIFVSLVQLMTNPEDYEGYRVSVSGYLADDAAYDQVSYEIVSTRVKRGCAEDAIVDGLLGILSEL